MVDVRGDVLWPPHGPTPAAVKYCLSILSDTWRYWRLLALIGDTSDYWRSLAILSDY